MEIKVTKNKIHLDDKSKLNENEYNINNIDFTFSEEYTQELVKIALFSANNTNYKEIITQNQCKIPSEILANEGVFVLGVYAYSTEDVYKLTEDTEIDEDKTYYTRTGSGTEEEPYEYTEVENPIAENLSTYYEKNVKLSLRYSPSPIKLVVDSGSYIPDEQTQNSEPITASELEQYQQALNDGLREAENVNISAEKVDKVATITIIDRYGDETSVEIQDGTDGIDGKDAKINGVNTLTIKAGQNIEIEQEENTLIINGQSNYNNLTNKPKINNVELTGNKTTSDLGIVIPDVSGFITKDVNNLTNYTLKTATGSLIDLEINQSTYVVTLTLKDIDGNVISTDNIDLPLESVVVGGRYDATNKKIVLTLENGNTVDIPVGDLIAGLQTEITSQNKLASDLVDDSNSGNKFVTTSEKQTWNAKYDKPNGGIPKTDLDSSVQTSLGKADTALQEHQSLADYVKNTDYATDNKGGTIKTSDTYNVYRDGNGSLRTTTNTYDVYLNKANNAFIGKGTLENVITGKNLETANNKVTEIDETSTDTEYPSAKLLYDELAEKQEQIDGLVTENALLKDQIPNGTAEGTNVQITDSSNLPIEDGVIKGYTSQDSTTGKNLVPNNLASGSSSGITYTVNSDGSIKLSGTATARVEPNLYFDINNPITFKAGTYRNTSSKLMILYADGYILASPNQTFTLDEDKNVIQIYFRIENGETVNETYYPQIILNSITDNTYEPYTGGQPSPNPNHPQDIHVVSGDNSIEVCGKNILPQDKYIASTTKKGITFTNNGDGTFNLSGTASDNTTIEIIPNGNLQLEANQPYYLYSSVPYNGTTFNMSIPMTDNETTKFFLANNTYTPTATPTNERLQFYIANGQSINQTNIKMMLIKGNTAPSQYEPHQSQTYKVDLGTIELCKIGDYQDYLFKNVRTLRSGRANPLFNADLDEGAWYKYGEIGKVVLDGSENWETLWSDSEKNLHSWNVSISDSIIYTDDLFKVNPILCDNFKTYGQTPLYTNQGAGKSGIAGRRNTNMIIIENNDITTLVDFKTWLSTHNTTIYYVLATPTYTKITDTALIAQLEAYYNSSTYRNVTNIITTGDDLAPIASIVYKKDLTTLFNKLDSLEARVDLLE